MKELIFYIVKKIVENPKDVKIEEIDGERIKILKLQVAQEDIGKLIGRGGKTIKALRTLLSAASLKEGKKFTLEVVS